MRSITRRAFLILAPAAAGAGTALLGLPGYLRKAWASNEAESGGGELGQVVEEYLKNFPQERDVHFLSESLAIELPYSADQSFLSAPTILLRIQQDFAEARTVSLAGWILSRTEVRGLALLSLLGR